MKRSPLIWPKVDRNTSMSRSNTNFLKQTKVTPNTHELKNLQTREFLANLGNCPGFIKNQTLFVRRISFEMLPGFLIPMYLLNKHKKLTDPFGGPQLARICSGVRRNIMHEKIFVECTIANNNNNLNTHMRMLNNRRPNVHKLRHSQIRNA